MQKIRLKALIAGVNSAISEHQVTVTGLGRNLRAHSKTKTKHDIKRMDRLIGNKHLHNERKGLYQYLTLQLVGEQKHPGLKQLKQRDGFRLVEFGVMYRSH